MYKNEYCVEWWIELLMSNSFTQRVYPGGLLIAYSDWRLISFMCLGLSLHNFTHTHPHTTHTHTHTHTHDHHSHARTHIYTRTHMLLIHGPTCFIRFLQHVTLHWTRVMINVSAWRPGPVACPLPFPVPSLHPDTHHWLQRNQQVGTTAVRKQERHCPIRIEAFGGLLSFSFSCGIFLHLCITEVKVRQNGSRFVWIIFLMIIMYLQCNCLTSLTRAKPKEKMEFHA